MRPPKNLGGIFPYPRFALVKRLIDSRQKLVSFIFNKKKTAIKKGGWVEKNNPSLVSPLIIRSDAETAE